jgi:hypothetical protein
MMRVIYTDAGRELTWPAICVSAPESGLVTAVSTSCLEVPSRDHTGCRPGAFWPASDAIVLLDLQTG